MALNLYRRHRQGREAGLPEETGSGEFEERVVQETARRDEDRVVLLRIF